MKRLSDLDVARAMTRVQMLQEKEAGPVLQPEQIDRIFSLRQETDPAVRLSRTMDLARALLEETEATKESYEALFRSQGIDPSRLAETIAEDRRTSGPLANAESEFEDALTTMESDLQMEVSRVWSQAMPANHTTAMLPPNPQPWA